MSIVQRNKPAGAVRRSGIQLTLYLSTFVPLLRTAPVGCDVWVYKHLTPNRVKTPMRHPPPLSMNGDETSEQTQQRKEDFVT